MWSVTMLTRASLCGPVLFASACQMPDAPDALSHEEALREGVPTTGQMGLDVPGAAAALMNVLPEVASDEGDGTDAVATPQLAALRRAPFYTLTRDTSQAVNGGTLALLAVIKTLAETAPAEVGESHRHWGPWTSSLEPLAYGFRIEVESDGGVGYKLMAKPKTADDGAWKTILVGDYRAERVYRGSGNVYVDVDAVQALDPAGNHGQGKVAIRWRNVTPPRTVEVKFLDFADRRGGEPLNAVFRYSEDPATAGSFEFVVRGDVVAGLHPTKPAAAESALRSRWLRSGAGRSDVVITGGDLPWASVRATECWNDAFQRVFYTDDRGHAPTEGSATTCEL